MSGNDHVIAPAVRDSLALCELREYAQYASHMSFDLAMRRAMVDALAHAAQRAAGETSEQVAGSNAFVAARPKADDV